MYEASYIRTNGITLHVVQAGPVEGEPIILLHGFPEFWYSWHRQIDYLASRGYRVIAPDQRGYNLSDKPSRVDDYRISILTQDVTGLADALGYDRINLAGHDWGAAVAWWVATMFPERLKKLIILNVPYPSLIRESYMKGHLEQILRSWYIGFFQIPWLPEMLSSVGDYEPVIQALRRSSKADTFSDADLERYRQAYRQPGALKAMLNWYRAMAQQSTRRTPEKREARQPVRITVPTLMLWGEQDVALTKDLAQPSIDLCQDGRLVFFPDATHWLQHDEPDAVNRLIDEFIGGPQPVMKNVPSPTDDAG